jgi:predicted KAP-like P-loop ATPase
MWRDSESDQDFLNFTELADQVATLVTTPDLLPISVGVFGGWGTGKSTVLRLVEAQLPAGEASKILLVKFDAWLYQGFDDARAALMEVVSSALLQRAEKEKTFLDKAKEFAGRVNYFRGLGMIADFGVGMAFGIPPGLLTRAGGLISSAIAGSATHEQAAQVKDDVVDAGKELKALVKPVEKRTPPKEIDAFRREFGELLEGLNVTLVLFIDNLDRCLPDAAIGTLEAVRLFLFMPRTAFVIAADEGMIRHSVAKHFDDPETSHVRDYLDKVIQVPLRVPQVGVEDLRAYMYSLLVGRATPASLVATQARLMTALQGAWKGDTFERSEIATLAGDPPGLLDDLAVADRLAVVLAGAPNVMGNPRIVKRLLNAVFLRRALAQRRNMNVDLATLAKLAVFERCTDEPATRELYRIVMGANDASAYLLPPAKLDGKKTPEMPAEWKKYDGFIEAWRAMEPLFGDDVDLRPAVFLSRDVMAPARPRAGLSEVVATAVAALVTVTSVNSPVGKQIVGALGPADRALVMEQLIDAMRPADWSLPVAGIHGALLLARMEPATAGGLAAFLSTVPKEGMEKGTRYLLKQSKLVDGL